MGDSVDHKAGLDDPTALLARVHHWRMAFFGLVVLLAGMLAGAAVTLVVLRQDRRQGPPPGPEAVVVRMLDQIGPRLRLSPDQRRQVNPILQRHVARFHEIREQGRAQIVEELGLMNEEVSAVLTRDQQRVWQRFLQELPGPFRRGFGPRRFGPGPQGRGGFGRGGPGGVRGNPEDAAPPPPSDTPSP